MPVFSDKEHSKQVRCHHAYSTYFLEEPITAKGLKKNQKKTKTNI